MLDWYEKKADKLEEEYAKLRKEIMHYGNQISIFPAMA